MSRPTTKSIVLNFSDLREISKVHESLATETNLGNEIKGTIFSVGSSPQISSGFNNFSANIFDANVLLDGLFNPYVSFRWTVDRFFAENGKILGFNVYRRKKNIISKQLNSSLQDIFSFDKISFGCKRAGKFSEQKKPIFNIERSLISKTYLNPQLDEMESNARSRFLASQDFGEQRDTSSQTSLPSDKEFKKIAFIDFSKNIEQQKNKQVFVSNKDSIEFFYEDETVGYGQIFEYFVTAILKDSEESPTSNVITVIIKNSFPISKPLSLEVKKIDENKNKLLIKINPKDYVANVLIYKKKEGEPSYKKIAVLQNNGNFVEYLDENVDNSISYYYRVFLINIHEIISEPEQIFVTPYTKSQDRPGKNNTLKQPSFSVSQDQLSNYIRISISTNDPNICYYELTRRDLTIFEKRFTSPALLNNNYGKNYGWESNRFYVKRNLYNGLAQTIKQEFITDDTFNKTINEYADSIEFIDKTIDLEHFYQYRIIGYDVHGNRSSAMFQTIFASPPKSIRAPINLRYEVIQNYPLKLKILWDDDNSFKKKGIEDFNYFLERKASDEKFYYSFFGTKEEFWVDEVQDQNIKRANDEPPYLELGKTYQYRVKIVRQDGQQSNFSKELKAQLLSGFVGSLQLVPQYDKNTFQRQIKLVWNPVKFVDFVDYFEIQRREGSGLSSFKVIGKVYLQSEYTDTSISLNTNYVYRVRLVDIYGNKSLYSDVSIKT